MNTSNRFPAFLAYIPVIGWLYVLFAERKNPFAMFHLRQSIGLVLFLIGTLAAWFVLAWLLAWIHFGTIFSVAFFTLVIAAYVYGVFAWITGMVNALQGKIRLLPIFGRWANSLPL
jgi:uncharacterized membrane protein